jgi:protein-tyrosine phosphatase
VITPSDFLASLRDKKEIHIEMVCLGNICRSPLAAAILFNKAEKRDAVQALPKIIVTSSGTANYHEGEGAHPLSQQVWQEAGYQYNHTARQFRREFFGQADLIACMDLTNRAILLGAANNEKEKSKIFMLRQFDPTLSHIDPTTPEASELTVPDPWGEPIDSYIKVRTMLESAIDGLISSIEKSRLSLR